MFYREPHKLYLLLRITLTDQLTMKMPLATIDDARRAKEKAKDIVSHLDDVVGIGLIEQDGAYAVKINLAHEIDRSQLPGRIDNVAVVWEVTGSVAALPTKPLAG